MQFKYPGVYHQTFFQSKNFLSQTSFWILKRVTREALESQFGLIRLKLSIGRAEKACVS